MVKWRRGRDFSTNLPVKAYSIYAWREFETLPGYHSRAVIYTVLDPCAVILDTYYGFTRIIVLVAELESELETICTWSVRGYWKTMIENANSPLNWPL
jgi:hypothetical protein